MKRKNVTVYLSILLANSAVQAVSLPENPNILLILVDDLGYGDLSCQGVANDVQTPNIDKLLTEGLRFTNFYANSPVCSPSRAALLTGRYPDLVGVPGLIRSKEDENWGFLAKDAVLLPVMLKKKGYHTAAIGKWNLGLTSPNRPRDKGFDYFNGFLDDMMDDYYTHLRRGRNFMFENEKEINPVGHATDIFTESAIEYLDRQKNKKNPFFLYLAYNAPHSPLQPPSDWLEKIKKRQPGLSEKRTKLIALIEHLDYGIGRVYQELEKNGQLENTLIIFTSDNGGDKGSDANNNPFRGSKQEMYEGGIHVAGGYYWKNKIKPSVTDNFTMQSDIFPTLCDLTGIPIKHEIDGISVLPTIRGEDQQTDNRTVFWVRREGGVYGGKAYYAARFKDFKLLQNTPYEANQLFNLRNDMKEQFPITDHSINEYKDLSRALTEHIRLSGSVPWETQK
jgi:arylsulfatase A-like enzyme